MSLPEENGRGRLRRALGFGVVAGAVSALLLLLIELGFPLNAAGQARMVIALQIVLWLAIACELLRLLANPDRRRHIGKHPWDTAVVALLAIALALEFELVPRLQREFPDLSPLRVELLYFGAIQLGVLALMLHRSLHFNRVLAFARVSPRLILIGSYLVLILIGALLLKVPNATTAPGSLPWIDALFTSTSAVCVTGLIVVDTATAFTSMGKIIVLVLIQLGGLGLMTFTYFFVSVFGGGVTLRDRALLLEYLNEEHVGRITSSLAAIIGMTFAFELLGAALLHFALGGFEPGNAVHWFDSLFHSISAFCNAGFSTYTLGLYDPVTRSNLGYQFAIMGLIVLGGLGFPVLRNLFDNFRSRIWRRRSARPPRLTTNTKLVLLTTIGLIVAGAIAALVLEYGFGDQPHYAGRGVTALFLSVTARTAGFNTVPVEGLLAPTVILLLALMFIGGSPASTAGGIKTTTFAIALLNTLHIMRNSAGGLVAFGRQIPTVLANRAFAIALLAITWVAGTSLVLTVLMPQHAPLDLIFEAVSAFGTVGLSRGVTPALPPLGKLVIIVSMIVGRIGILYVALGVLRKERPGRLAYPEENVIIS